MVVWFIGCLASRLKAKVIGPLAPTSLCFDAYSSILFTPGVKWPQ